MRAEVWLCIKATLSELFHPTWDDEDRPDLDADTAARTEWVRGHRRDVPPEAS